MGKPMFDVTRFDIEDEIMQICNYSEQLRNYADMVYDGQWVKDDLDSLHTTLHGFANMLEAHANKMNISHCKHYRLNEYAPDDWEIKQNLGNVE